MPRKPRSRKPEPSPNPGVNPAVDHVTPGESVAFGIAAIGASAGGLESFTQLLRALPADTGMAFVLIQHLVPTHESMLAQILARATTMPVHEVENNMPVEPDNVYVIPPGKSMVLGHGLLQLAPRTEVKGIARPIDHFMRSLAEEHGHKAIGVVLSGTGNDGTLGLQEIKAGGGFTFAQDATAEHGAMPSSAIAGGAVDMVLPVDAIAHELARIGAHPLASIGPREPLPLAEAGFTRVVHALASGTDVDFTSYKKNTLYRRIARRMMVRRIEAMDDYARLVESDPAELEALYRDVLINVTSFFRNPEAYEALKTEVFPALAAERGRDGEIRIWALGCSTGEEAYSLAMTFTEYLESSGKRVGLQVFATDLNSAGIERARAGVYSKGIEQDVSPERLRRFFVEVDGSYRIAKPIRDMCVFARQNVITDPPFSRIDLVACRNMLIYLEPALQQKLIPLLHYALRPHGFLWLGGSETIGIYRQLFDLVDVRNKIYAKKPDAREVAPASARRRSPQPRWQIPSGAMARAAAKAASAAPDVLGEADRLLLARYAPPTVVVDSALEVIQYRGDTGPYLTPAPGKASLAFMKMLRENLVVPVRGALHRAKEDGAAVRVEGVRVKADDAWREVDVVAAPLGAKAGGGFVVLFEEAMHSRESRARKMHAEADARIDRDSARGEPTGEAAAEISRLSQELAATREYLQSVIEQQEAANEELQSANEEAQSTNEELQSVNEELETSKEEIQSSNEELLTLNQELTNRNSELARVNDDLVNFMGSAQMAIVVVGPDLRIRRFTAMAEKSMNLLPADVGRAISGIRTGLTLDDLDALVRETIDTVSVREREVRDRAGRWYSLRVRPYRTLGNRIDGAVLVLVDIDDLKRAQYALMESERRFELLADSAPVLIWVSDAEGMRFVNRAFESFVGASEHEIQVAEPERYVHRDDRTAYADAYRNAFARKEAFEMRFRMRRADGAYRWMKTVATPSFLTSGEMLGLVGCTFDVTDMKEAEAALVEFDHGKDRFLAMLAHELRNPLAAVRNASQLLSRSKDPLDHAVGREIIERQTDHMARMIEDLLDVARITHGKIVLRSRPLDLVASVREAVASTQAARAAHRQHLTPSLPAGALWVNGDAMRLQQVFVNLLDNATKFTRDGGHIWLMVERESVDSGQDGPRGFAAVRVRDDGMGIPRALLPRVFELFTQGEEASSERSRAGIGVGLSLARSLVELHGGSIAAFSAGESLGSEFVLRFPLLEQDRVPADRGPEARAESGPATPRRRILLVDDNHDVGDALRGLLAALGHEVAVARDGADALARARHAQPDIVLLDINLPDMDGYEVARRLRAMDATRHAVIFALSGLGQPEDPRRSREAGIEGHMTKPVDVDQLEACFEGALAGRSRGGGE